MAQALPCEVGEPRQMALPLIQALTAEVFQRSSTNIAPISRLPAASETNLNPDVSSTHFPAPSF